MCLFAKPTVIFLPRGSLRPFISPMPAHPMPVASPSTFLCSQDLYWLALLLNTHLPSGERRARSPSHTLYWHWEAEVHHAFTYAGTTKAHRTTALCSI